MDYWDEFGKALEEFYQKKSNPVAALLREIDKQISGSEVQLLAHNLLLVFFSGTLRSTEQSRLRKIMLNLQQSWLNKVKSLNIGKSVMKIL